MLDAIVVKISNQYSNFAADTSPRTKALLIASYLRENNLTGVDRGRDYHDLAHNFLGMALKDQNHNSLPLISAAIYCYIAQSFGLKARPCGFPFHVHVIIIPPPGIDMDGRSLSDGSTGETMYMDPFRSANETPVSDLKSQLNYLGATGFEQSHFLGESLTPEIVLRCGKNILNSIQLTNQPLDPASTPVDPVGARYAGLWSTILCIGAVRPMELRQHLPPLMELFATDFPSDIGLIERYLVPLCRGFLEYEHLLESLHIMRAVDEMPKQLRHRTDEHQNVRYHIGQVFCHRRYNYRAIITGWDAECGANEEWVRRMGIDRLQGGRYQSFYHSL
jgi:F-box protein 21